MLDARTVVNILCSHFNNIAMRKCAQADTRTYFGNVHSERRQRTYHPFKWE